MSINTTQLDDGLPYQDILTALNLADSKTGWGSFSQRHESDYLRFIEDKDLSMSLNYFSHVEDTVRVGIVEKGLEALTDEAREIYENDAENFGLRCGDNYISSYKEGALYMYSLVAEFESAYDKQLFLEHNFAFTTNSTMFDIVTASISLNKTFYEYDIRGTFHAVAF